MTQDMNSQIISTLSDEGSNLILNCIDFFYLPMFQDTGIHGKEKFRNLWKKKVSKTLKMCITPVRSHRFLSRFEQQYNTKGTNVCNNKTPISPLKLRTFSSRACLPLSAQRCCISARLI